MHSNVLTVPYRGFGYVPDGSQLDNVAYNKLLDRFVLGDAASTVCATHSLHVPSVVFAATSIATFLSLQIVKILVKQEIMDWFRGALKYSCR